MQARYADSIESLVRNNIQKIKTDMANEVIDAGRFDMETTMAERKNTLESMLQACQNSPDGSYLGRFHLLPLSSDALLDRLTRCFARPGLV